MNFEVNCRHLAGVAGDLGGVERTERKRIGIWRRNLGIGQGRRLGGGGILRCGAEFARVIA